MLTQSKRKLLFWSSVIVFIAMMPVVILYALGYRLDDTWSLKKTGGIYVSSDLTGSEVFIDGELERRTNLLQNGAFIDNLAPGVYDILVLKENYLPWNKILPVSSQLVTEAHALLIPRETNGEILLRGNFSNINASPINQILALSEEKSGLSAVVGEKIVRWYLPEQRQFLTDTGALLRYKSSFEIIRWLPEGIILKLDNIPYRVRFNIQNGTATVIPLGNETAIKNTEEVSELLMRRDNRGFIEILYIPQENKLVAKWIGEINLPYYFSSEEEILIENKPLKNFEFYPVRRDVVLASFDNGVFAIEIDGRGERNIQPVYKGKAPNFEILPGSDQVYILDDGILIEVKLRAEE